MPGGERFHFNDPRGNDLAIWSDVARDGVRPGAQRVGPLLLYYRLMRSVYLGNLSKATVALVALLLGQALFDAPRPARAAERPTPSTCTYEAQTWNVALQRSVNARRVVHP